MFLFERKQNKIRSVYTGTKRQDRMGTSWSDWTIFTTALSVLTVILLISSCKTIQYIPVKETVKETVTVTDTIIKTKLEKEYVTVNTGICDTTSVLETKYAISTVKINGTNMVHGLENKDSAEIKTVYKTVWFENVKELPVPYEVPKPFIPQWIWISLLLNAIVVGYVVFTIVKSFKGFVNL